MVQFQSGVVMRWKSKHEQSRMTLQLMSVSPMVPLSSLPLLVSAK